MNSWVNFKNHVATMDSWTCRFLTTLGRPLALDLLTTKNRDLPVHHHTPTFWSKDLCNNPSCRCPFFKPAPFQTNEIPKSFPNEISKRHGQEFPMDEDLRDAPKMTVNLKRLTRVLAKQWTEVSSEELWVKMEPLGMIDQILNQAQPYNLHERSFLNRATATVISRFLIPKAHLGSFAVVFFFRFGSGRLLVRIWRPWNIKEDYDH